MGRLRAAVSQGAYFQHNGIWCMKGVLKAILLAALLSAASMLSGCTLLYGDSLLALPSLPAEYVELQKEINKVLSTGAVSAAAESGGNRQAIQLVDIDGDGVNETVAFFREQDGNYLIKAYKKDQENYVEIGTARAVGLTLHSIYYPVVSATGQRCLAVCWGIDESNNYGMDVYSFGVDGMTSILNVQYSGIFVGDLYDDGLDELCFSVRDQMTGQLALRVYSFSGGGYVMDGETPLCSEARGVLRMSLGISGGGTQALFLDSSASGGGYVTDVIAYSGRKGRLTNITSGADGHDGMDTWRAIEAYSSDIDGDGVTEVPRAYATETAYSDDKNRLEWIEFSASGRESRLKTYHMPSDGWYLKWPENWDDNIMVQTTRYSRMSKTVFFLPGDEFDGSAVPTPDEKNTLLTIYVFSGDNRQAYLSVYEAQELAGRDGVLYAYSFGAAGETKYGLDDQSIKESFVKIDNEWTSEAY